MCSALSSYDWHSLAERSGGPGHTTTRHRLRWILAAYAIALAAVLARAVQLEVTGGSAHREIAARPIEKLVALPAARGRIVARDGTPLAVDIEARALAVHYRYLETPPNPAWLRRQARSRLSRSARRDPAQIAATEAAVRRDLADLHRRLARLCGVSDTQWSRRRVRIQDRVTALAEQVNRRRKERFAEQTSTIPDEESPGFMGLLAGLFSPPAQLPPAEVTVAEEAAYHRLVDELPAEVVSEIEQHADAFPGVQVVTVRRRSYPLGSVASNLLGHVGAASSARSTLVAREDAADAETLVGLQGLERDREATLRGAVGRARKLSTRGGEPIATQVDQPPVAGRDVTLALDVRLQQFAEQLLDRFAQQRARRQSESAEASGGAILVMDVRSGELVCAAGEPRFDPNWFATGDPRVEAVLADPGQPLFDRATRMALPPGSVFKPLVALALVEHGVVGAEQPFSCQGFLDEPDRMRCQVFRQHGIGHGDVTLAGALAQSCNVYFFHHVTGLGAERLTAWTRRCGFGSAVPSTSGAELPGGRVPAISELTRTDALQAMAVGQGTLTATPLEVLRLYAAIANGGYLVPVRLTPAREHGQHTDADRIPPLPNEWRIAGLSEPSLAAVREGLRRVVDDPSGTGYESVRTDVVAIAGKTGTAQTGEEADHAWFAGYAPAAAPRFAFVVVLEHGGSGADVAGAMTRQLVGRMSQLGYFGAPRVAEQFPPGKG